MAAVVTPTRIRGGRDGGLRACGHALRWSGDERNHRLRHRPRYYSATLAGDIEARWQRIWTERGTFEAPNPVGPLAGDLGDTTGKLFVQDMFPYPSGSGLHVGHPLGFIASDVYARFHRMIGVNVLHTMGFDAFGLPAEQYAVQTGTHPRTTTEANVERYLEQIRRLGLGHDERRRVSTTDVDFYRWTQWIFLQIHGAWYDEDADRARPVADLIAEFDSGERTPADGSVWADLDEAGKAAVVDSYRLVYQSDSMVNWCPGLGPCWPTRRSPPTAGAIAATSRCSEASAAVDDADHRVLRSPPRRPRGARLAGQGEVDAAELDRTLPRCAGVVLDPRHRHPVEVFTTRPDTLFGATYMVLAPEHDLVDQIVAETWPADVDARWTGGAGTPAEAVAGYRASIAAKSDLERQESKEKTGVFTGAYAVNPVNGQQVPVFIADYVLIGYGTGAIMAVPAHDGRDFEFATAFGLPIVEVIGSDEGVAEAAYVGDGPLVNSDFLDGLRVDEAKAAIIERLEADGTGTGTVQYKLRDWLFARQRYWGEPFPIVYDDAGQAHQIPESQLPVELPEVDDFAPVSFDPDDADSVPSPPLAKAADWVNVELDLGDGLQHYTRDTNVMPQWAGSSWYQLRYIDPTDETASASPRTSGTGWVRGRISTARTTRRTRPLHRRRRARGAAPALRPLLAQGAVRPRARVEHRAYRKLYNQA